MDASTRRQPSSTRRPSGINTGGLALLSSRGVDPREASKFWRRRETAGCVRFKPPGRPVDGAGFRHRHESLYIRDIHDM